MTAEEYSDSVRAWLAQAYQWQALAYSFPSYLAYQASLQQQQQNNNTNTSSSRPAQESTQQSTGSATPPTPELEWHEFTIPPLWKRVVAEIIDFFILFILKLVITFVAVDWFSLVDLDSDFRYDMSFWTAAAGGTADLDIQAAQDLFDFTSDFVLLEMIHRLVVCIFEALCLHRGFGRHTGGATPGKLLLGLRVVSCFQITAVPDNRVQISPAKDIGIVSAVTRAILKNAAMAFFLPVFFTFIYNRTVYDIMSKSIVVEVPSRRRERRRQD